MMSRERQGMGQEEVEEVGVVGVGGVGHLGEGGHRRIGGEGTGRLPGDTLEMRLPCMTSKLVLIVIFVFVP